MALPILIFLGKALKICLKIHDVPQTKHHFAGGYEKHYASIYPVAVFKCELLLLRLSLTVL